MGLKQRTLVFFGATDRLICDGSTKTGHDMGPRKGVSKVGSMRLRKCYSEPALRLWIDLDV